MTLSKAEAAALDIENAYALACSTPGDIHEHLPVLRWLAADVAGVTGSTIIELGTRSVVSTWAFLAARPWFVLSVDIENAHLVAVATCAEVCRDAGQLWEFKLADSLTMEPAPCDLLFIDTLHVYAQLRAELKRHGPHARRWIALHDTEKYGDVGDFGTTPGLKAAVNEFLASPEGAPFEIALHLTNCCGLTVLRRTA